MQITDDGINCIQKIYVNDNKIWEIRLTCPPKFEAAMDVHMCGDDTRVMDGQIRNFKFFTHEI